MRTRTTVTIAGDLGHCQCQWQPYHSMIWCIFKFKRHRVGGRVQLVLVENGLSLHNNRMTKETALHVATLSMNTSYPKRRPNQVALVLSRDPH